MYEDLREIVKTGDRRATLEAIRDVLAEEMGRCASNEIAKIAGRLQAVIRELDELPLTETESKSDELLKRRAARRKAAQG